MSFIRLSSVNVIPGLDPGTAPSFGSVDLESVLSFVEENSYEETIKIVAGTPTSAYEIQAAVDDGNGHWIVPANTVITFPPDSRDGESIPEYKVGSRVLNLFNEVRGQDWEEVGAAGEMSNQIRMLRPLYEGEQITFRMFFVRSL